jgi:hypothetical protein
MQRSDPVLCDHDLRRPKGSNPRQFAVMFVRLSRTDGSLTYPTKQKARSCELFFLWAILGSKEQGGVI